MSLHWTLVVAIAPPALILLLCIVAWIFGPRAYAKRNAVPTATAIAPDRIKVARNLATARRIVNLLA